MLGFAVPSGVKVGLAIGAAVVVSGGVLWVQGLRATIAEQEAEIVAVTVERNQEKVTAEWNAQMALRTIERAAKETAERQRVAGELAAERRKNAERMKEVRRAPSARDPVPDAFDAFLRRVQPSP